MLIKIKKTWKRLGLKQKWSLVGLLLLSVAMPVTIVASVIETHLASQASDFTYQTRMLYKKNSLAPMQRISPIAEKKYPSRVPTDCRIGGCNGELCLGILDPQIESMCALREYDQAEMLCRKTYATCELQASGTCGWSFDPKYDVCLTNPPQLNEIEITGTAEKRYVGITDRSCGNNLCESGEGDSKSCALNDPESCRIIQGKCPSDCQNNQPAGRESCTLGCGDNQQLDPYTCTCYPIETPETSGEIESEEAISDYCSLEGGTLTLMKGCGDNCNTLTDQLVACPAGDATLSCDCGPHACWNGTTCVKNPRSNLRKDRLSLFGFQSWFSGVNSFFDSFFR